MNRTEQRKATIRKKLELTMAISGLASGKGLFIMSKKVKSGDRDGKLNIPVLWTVRFTSFQSRPNVMLHEHTWVCICRIMHIIS